MNPRPSTISALGLCQCVFWATLYYGFSIWQTPLRADLGDRRGHVAAAFSLGLLLMAALAPRIGRAFDRGQGRAVVRLAAVAAVSGLLMLAVARSLFPLYVAWLLIGAGMAGLLYDSAFALVHRAIDDAVARVRALATVTLFGGFASTLGGPILGALVASIGWRWSVAASALVVFIASLWLDRRILPAMTPTTSSNARHDETPASPRPRANLASLQLVFATATFSAMALTCLLVPHLVANGTPLSTAATVLAALGLAQWPGRAWLSRRARAPSSSSLLLTPLLLQAAGLVVVALAHGPLWATIGVATFGLGAGVHTLARPWLVHSLHGADAGACNGRIARAQGIARALAPAITVGLATIASTQAVLLSLALILLALSPLAAQWSHAPSSATPSRDHAMERASP